MTPYDPFFRFSYLAVRDGGGGGEADPPPAALALNKDKDSGTEGDDCEMELVAGHAMLAV
jgi:hypothetical protein